MQEIETISIVLATAGLLVGIIYHIIGLRNARQTRQASLYMQFLTTGMDKDLIKDFMEVNEWVWKDMEEFSKVVESPDAKAKFGAVLQYITGMSTMVKNNLIEIDMIPIMLEVSIHEFWKKYKPLFGTFKRWTKVEYFYQEMQKWDTQYYPH